MNKNYFNLSYGKKHTEETKQKLSKIRKEYLKNNPDKHPWKNNSKFKSVPCEKFKEKLRLENISFVEEYQPLIPENYYSIDIAFPDKKIGIEINGNQHYNSDKSLKPYYQQKHDKLVNNGWKIFEYHYSIVYCEKTLNEIVDTLKNDYNLDDVDYSFYLIKKRENSCLLCGKNIVKTAKHCVNCFNKFVHKHNKKRGSNKNKRKIKTSNNPEIVSKKERILKFEVSKEELQELVKTYPFTTIGKKFNVSDNSIRKRCKKFGIEIPKREPGYWAKKYAEDSKNQNTN